MPMTAVVYADTSAHTALSVIAFTVLADAVFTVCTGITGTSTITFPKGVTIYASISAITLASGTIVVYS